MYSHCYSMILGGRGGGSICLRYLHVFSMYWYFLISSYYLTVSLYLSIIWLFRMGAHWPHWKAKSSLWALAVSNGGEGGREGGSSALGIYMFSLCTGISLYLLIIWLFPYIFLLFGCFEWVLIDHIEKQRVHSELWQFQMGGREGGFGSFTRVNLKIWAHYIIRSSVWLFPYIFLLFDCFEWALIDHIEKQRVNSELWQFQMGGGREGGFVSFTRVNLKIWAHLPFDALLHRRSFRITYERPNKLYAKYSIHTWR